MQKKLQNKTIIRMAISFVAVFLLPMIVLYFLYTGQITTAIATEVEEMTANDLRASVELIDSNIQSLNDTIKLFQRGNGYQSYLTRGFAYDKSGDSSNMNLESDIPYIYLLNGAEDDFFLVLPDADTVFAISGMHRTGSYFEKYYAVPEGADNPAYDVLHCAVPTVRCDKALATHHGIAETLSFIYPLSKNAKGLGGTAVFCVQTARFTAYFQPRSEDFQTSTFVFDANGQYLFSYHADDLLVQDVKTSAVQPNELFTAPSTGKEYFSIERTSTLNGWRYLTLLPRENTLYKNIFEINRFFRLYLLLTLGIGILMIVGLLWLNYRPILALRKKAKTMLSAEAPAGDADDLDTIFSALNFLEARNSTLNDTVSQNIREIQAARLHRLLTNYYESIDEFNVDCEQIGLSFHGDRFYVSIILFQTLPPDAEQMPELVLREFPDTIETKCLYMPNQNRLVMIHCPQENRIDTEPFFSVLGLLHDRLNCQAVIGIGRLYPGAAVISKSYLQAAAALDYRTCKGDKTVITYDEVLAHDADSHQYPTQEIRCLTNALAARKTGARDQILDALIAQIRSPATSLMNARCIAFDLIKALMSDPTLSQETAYWLPEALTQLSQEKAKKNVVSLVEDARRRVSVSAQAVPERQNDALLDEIISYIRQNYRRCDFSIQEIAEHFEMLPSNIGSYFKEQTGKGLLEYLIDLRIRQAKELLHSTDMTVKEISVSVGYYNDSSFIRRFKQHEGVTPNEYRFKC